jgi:4-alpha-glucanotransferase
MRQAGVLIPLFSIRTRAQWGVGEIPDLVPFARWAASSGFSVVQVLPVNEASRGQNSPYAALSAFAIDPVYLALDAVEDFTAAGGLDALGGDAVAEVARLRASPGVAWDAVRALKRRALALAFERFREHEWRPRTGRARALEAFAAAQASWLDDYAVFVALHDRNGGAEWSRWEDAALRAHEPAAVAAARAALADRVLYHEYVQWQLDLQWHAARRAANGAGVELMGDLPFMVAGDSADVWSRQRDFRLDARVGVPPDMFSATGQDWGLPVYRWDLMRAEEFPWLGARAHRSAELYGIYRIDHLVGFYRTYYREGDETEGAFIPAEEPDQTALGEKVIEIFSREARVVAEDLGVVPDFVRASLARLGVPGYRVLRWEREWDDDGQPWRDPGAYPAISVATSGTHDTDSLADWYEGMPEAERDALHALPALAALRARAPRFDVRARDAILDLLYRSASDLLLLPFQDAFGARERVNVPGTVNDENWTYRMPLEVAELYQDRGAVERLRGLAHRSGRDNVSA